MLNAISKSSATVSKIVYELLNCYDQFLRLSKLINSCGIVVFWSTLNSPILPFFLTLFCMSNVNKEIWVVLLKCRPVTVVIIWRQYFVNLSLTFLHKISKRQEKEDFAIISWSKDIIGQCIELFLRRRIHTSENSKMFSITLKCFRQMITVYLHQSSLPECNNCNLNEPVPSKSVYLLLLKLSNSAPFGNERKPILF